MDFAFFSEFVIKFQKHRILINHCAIDNKKPAISNGFLYFFVLYETISWWAM